MSRIAAIVLAAGESRRMGAQNKLLLPWKSHTLIEHVVDTIIASEAAEVIVVLGHEAEKIRERLRRRAVRFVANPAYRLGLTTSIQAGARAAHAQADGFMICQADLPLITSREYSRLIQAFESAAAPRRIIVPAYRGQRGNPVIFSSDFKEAILAHRGLQGCKGLIQENPDLVMEIEMANDHILLDIDTEETYTRLLRRK